MHKNTRPRKRPNYERKLLYLRRVGLLPHGVHACDVQLRWMMVDETPVSVRLQGEV